MNTITEQVKAALDGLGSTARQIATTLANKGIKGLRSDPERCAITVYLNQQFPDFHIETGRFHTNVWTNEGAQTVYFNQEQQYFVFGFDQGAYPDLMLPERPLF